MNGKKRKLNWDEERSFHDEQNSYLQWTQLIESTTPSNFQHMIETCSKNLLKNPSIQYDVAFKLVEKIQVILDKLSTGEQQEDSIVKSNNLNEQSISQIQKILRCLSQSNIHMNEELCEQLLGLLLIPEISKLVIHELPRFRISSSASLDLMENPTKPKQIEFDIVQTIIQTFKDLLETDRHLLIPILGAVADLPLTDVASKKEMADLAMNSLGSVSEEDLPTVIRSLLHLISPSNGVEIISEIRTQCSDIDSKCFVLIFEIIETALRFNNKSSHRYFVQVLKTISNVCLFDILLFVTLLKHTKNPEENIKLLRILFLLNWNSYLKSELIQQLEEKHLSFYVQSIIELFSGAIQCMSTILTTKEDVIQKCHWFINLLKLFLQSHPKMKNQILPLLLNLAVKSKEFIGLEYHKNKQSDTLQQVAYQISHHSALSLLNISKETPQLISPFVYTIVDHLNDCVDQFLDVSTSPALLDILCHVIVNLCQFNDGLNAVVMIVIQKKLFCLSCGIHSTSHHHQIGLPKSLWLTTSDQMNQTIKSQLTSITLIKYFLLPCKDKKISIQDQSMMLNGVFKILDESNQQVSQSILNMLSQLHFHNILSDQHIEDIKSYVMKKMFQCHIVSQDPEKCRKENIIVDEGSENMLLNDKDFKDKNGQLFFSSFNIKLLMDHLFKNHTIICGWKRKTIIDHMKNHLEYIKTLWKTFLIFYNRRSNHLLWLNMKYVLYYNEDLDTNRMEEMDVGMLLQMCWSLVYAMELTMITCNHIQTSFENDHPMDELMNALKRKFLVTFSFREKLCMYVNTMESIILKQKNNKIKRMNIMKDEYIHVQIELLQVWSLNTIGILKPLQPHQDLLFQFLPYHNAIKTCEIEGLSVQEIDCTLLEMIANRLQQYLHQIQKKNNVIVGESKDNFNLHHFLVSNTNGIKFIPWIILESMRLCKHLHRINHHKIQAEDDEDNDDDDDNHHHIKEEEMDMNISKLVLLYKNLHLLVQMMNLSHVEQIEEENKVEMNEDSKILLYFMVKGMSGSCNNNKEEEIDTNDSISHMERLYQWLIFQWSLCEESMLVCGINEILIELTKHRMKRSHLFHLCLSTLCSIFTSTQDFVLLDVFPFYPSCLKILPNSLVLPETKKSPLEFCFKRKKYQKTALVYTRYFIFNILSLTSPNQCLKILQNIIISIYELIHSKLNDQSSLSIDQEHPYLPTLLLNTWTFFYEICLRCICVLIRHYGKNIHQIDVVHDFQDELFNPPYQYTKKILTLFYQMILLYHKAHKKNIPMEKHCIIPLLQCCNGLNHAIKYQIESCIAWRNQTTMNEKNQQIKDVDQGALHHLFPVFYIAEHIADAIERFCDHVQNILWEKFTQEIKSKGKGIGDIRMLPHVRNQIKKLKDYIYEKMSIYHCPLEEKDHLNLKQFLKQPNAFISVEPLKVIDPKTGFVYQPLNSKDREEWLKVDERKESHEEEDIFAYESFSEDENENAIEGFTAHVVSKKENHSMVQENEKFGFSTIIVDFSKNKIK